MVSAAHIWLSEITRGAFATLSDAFKSICCVNDTEFRQLTDSHDMETGDSLFGNVDLVLTGFLYNVRDK